MITKQEIAGKQKLWIGLTFLIALYCAFDQSYKEGRQSSIGQLSAEEGLGLPFLYRLRGARPPPDNIIIVTPNRKAGTTLGHQGDVVEWNRRLHADVIDKLSVLGAKLIVFDIRFSRYREDKSQDLDLVRATEEAGNVIYVQKFDTALIAGEDRYPILKNPIVPIAETALTLAPLKIEREGETVNKISPFLRILTDTEKTLCNGYPTKSDRDIEDNNIFGKTIRPSLAPSLHTSIISLLIKPAVRDTMSEGYEKPLNCLNLENYSDNGSNPEMSASVASSLSQFIQSPLKPFYMNYYGPAGTLNLIDYAEFLKTESLPYNFHNAIVFVGYTNLTGDSQKDWVSTPYNRNGIFLDGVEVGATAVSNSIEQSFLRPVSALTAFFICAFLSAAIYLITKVGKLSRFIIVVAGIACLYIYIALFLFKNHNAWIPIIYPAIVLTGVLISLETLWRYVKEKKGHQSMTKTMEMYLPVSAVKRLQSQPSPNSSFTLTQGACLVTDIQGFSTIAEKLSPIEMAERTSEYFELLNKCIASNGGEVFLIDGDSLTGVWDDTNDIASACVNAHQAGIDISESVKEFNLKYREQPFVTRMGLDAGEFAIGNVGSSEHYAFAVIGTTVYTASRLEQLNKETGTQFLTTSRVATHLRNSNAQSLGEKKIRGLENPTEIFQLL